MNRHFGNESPVAWMTAALAALLIACPPAVGAPENLGRGRVPGKVVDENKVPLAGVQIMAQSLTSLSTKLEAKTDSKGGFVVGGMGTGMWRFTASKEGFQTAVQDVDVHQLRANPLVVLVLRSFAAAAAEDTMQKEAGDALERGNQLLLAEKYAEARVLLEKFRSDHPEAYPVGLQIGMCWLKEGELDQAEAELKLLLENVVKKSGSYDQEAPLAMQALSGLGEAALKRGDNETGMKYFRHALLVSPTSEILAYNVAEILFANQKADEAVPYYLQAIQIKKEWPKPYRKLGLAYLNKGDMPKALEYLRQFVALDPESAEAAEARATIAALEKMK